MTNMTHLAVSNVTFKGGSPCPDFNPKMSILKETLVVFLLYPVGLGNNSNNNDDDVLNLEPCFRAQVNVLFSVTLSLAIDLQFAPPEVLV